MKPIPAKGMVAKSDSFRFVRNVLLKGAILFVIVNLLFAGWFPLEGLGKLSAYNAVFPGRERFPFGEKHEEAYNFSLYNLDAMFASHVINGEAKPESEYRILVIGDSSVWGALLRPDETLAGQLNSEGMRICMGKTMKVFNLGYPTLSLTKDLMILNEAMRYEPDMVVWLVTLESFPVVKQLSSPLAANNASRIQSLIQNHELNLDTEDPSLSMPSFWKRSIVGQRRSLADLVRLQLYGVLWAATGIDQVYPYPYQPAQRDLVDDKTFYDLKPPLLDADRLAFDVLDAGMDVAGDVPVLLVNEPILISEGLNSDVRYNFYYPRWAYDEYRSLLAERAEESDWLYVDLWDLVGEAEFTNSAIHVTPESSSQLAGRVRVAIEREICVEAETP